MPPLRVERDAVRVDVRPLEQHLAVARGVEDEQAPGRARVVAVVLLGARVGEPEATVGTEGEVVRAGEPWPAMLDGELLDACRPRRTRWMPGTALRSPLPGTLPPCVR